MEIDTKSSDKENEYNKKNKLEEEEEYIDREVNLEAELMSALEEIDRIRKKNRK
jgi:hypothetical protein